MTLHTRRARSGRRSPVRAMATALLVCMFVVTSLPTVQADDLSDQRDDLDDRIAATEDALATATGRLRRAAEALAEVQAEIPEVREVLDSFHGRLNTARTELAAIRQRLRQLDAQRANLLSEIASARDRVARSETLIARIVRYQYQTAGFAEMQVVLQAESPTEFVQRVMATQSVTETQAHVIDELNASKAVLVAQEQQFEVTEQAIEDAEADAKVQVDRLRTLTQGARQAAKRLRKLESIRSRALQIAREEKRAELIRLEQLEQAQEALEAQIAQAVSTGTGQASGPLAWPLPGAAAGQGVGWRTHPVYGYRSCHTGVDIGASSGTPILAADDGVVVWARSELAGPWGNNILIDHGNGLSTFYPHQSSFNVSPGQRVSTGDVIGYVGATGYATGPHLHFEVHVNGVPYDPMGWFGGSRTSKAQFCP